MSQTKEIRIYKHYQAMRHGGKHGPGGCFISDDSNLILMLAKHWKLPCKEIKNIVRAAQNPTE